MSDRVLMVVRPSKGGAFGHAVRLGRGLRERGYETAICGPHGHLRGELDLDLIELDIPRRPSPVRHARAVRELGRIYRNYRPTVVHAHGSQGGVVARVARSMAPRLPVAFTPHNYAFTNYFTNPLERGAYRGIEISLAPLASRVICVCEAERRIAASIGPRSRTRVVYNGIEPLAVAPPLPVAEERRREGPVIGVVAELQPPKGVRTAIEAMPTVLARSPRASLLIAGDGVERAELEARARTLGVAERVLFLGHLDGVASLLSSIDAFAQPGWAESFPYSILEAMSLGLPIVATDVGGCGEAIEDGVTGRLVPRQDPVALGEAIAFMLADSERSTALGKAGRERMMERFQLTTMVEGTLAVYRELGLS